MDSITVSVTEVQSFMRCRRMWAYSSPTMMSLGPIAPRRALSLGKVIHAAFAEWLQSPEVPLAELFLLRATAEREALVTAYRKQVGANISAEELAPFMEAVELGIAMCTNYQKKWGMPLFNGFDLMQAEVRVELPIPNTPHKLLGRMDAIIRRVSNGDIFVLEHKTYSSRPRLPSLQMNAQFLAYTWMAQQLGLGKVVGVAYDGLWVRAAPPRGSTFDDLFTRVIITRPQAEVEAFPAYIAEAATDMAKLAAARNDAALYPNRQWQGCYDCSFEELCTLQSRGEDWEHYRDTRFIKLDTDKEAMVAENE